MKREEKNLQTRRRILDAALEEFSAQGYSSASTNTICTSEGISKGIVYHYFETKDGLFLACVDECFTRLTEYIRQNMSEKEDPKGRLEDYFAVRSRFFYSYPVYQQIFGEAVLRPPKHLKEEIQKSKKSFEDLNIEILKQLLSSMKLQDGISIEEVIDIFRQFQDFISVQYQVSAPEHETFDQYTDKCRKALNVLLYGVIERK